MGKEEREGIRGRMDGTGEGGDKQDWDDRNLRLKNRALLCAFMGKCAKQVAGVDE